MNTSKILATLPTLSKPDLSAIRAAADSLLGPQAVPIEGASTPLFDVITRALGLRIGFEVIRQGQAYKPYRRGEAAVTAFIDEMLPDFNTKVARNGLLTFMVECLMDDLKERKVPISIGTLCTNLERCPQVFRAAFPGYLESGHAHLIVKKMLKRR
jgi:hypothetical protein